MSIWYFISVYLHIVAACFWIGGMLFLPLAILPVLKGHPQRVEFLFKTGIKFRFYGWIALIISTGLLNLYFRDIPFTYEFFTKASFGKWLSWKLILFVLMLMISAVHDFFIGGKAIEEMKNKMNPNTRVIARWTGRINLLIALAMAFIGLILSRGGNL
jgi:putative copper export protein